MTANITVSRDLADFTATRSYDQAARLSARLHGFLLVNLFTDTQVSMPVPIDNDPAGRYAVTITRARPQHWTLQLIVGADGRVSDGVYARLERAPDLEDPMLKLLDLYTDGMLGAIATKNRVILFPTANGDVNPVRVGAPLHKWENGK